MKKGSAWIVGALIGAARLHGQPTASDDVVLEPGKVIEREISGTQTHSYRLALAEGACTVLIVEQRGIDVSATVYDPSAKPVAAFDFEKRKTGEERVLVVAEIAGEYRVVIRVVYPQAPAAHYAVRIAERRSATGTERSVFEARRLSLEAGQLYTAGKFADAIAALERAVEMTETALGREDIYVGDLLIKLGVVEQRVESNKQAEAHLKRSLAISEKALGRGHPQTIEAIRWLGMVYKAEGEYGKAEPLLEEHVGAIERGAGAGPSLND